MKKISTLAKDKTELSALIHALYAMGYQSHGYTADKFIEGGYLHVVLYMSGDIGGNYNTDTYDVKHHGPLVSVGELLFEAAKHKFTTPPKVEVKLNDTYTAEIINDGKTVKVGCQEFPASKVLELAALLKK